MFVGTQLIPPVVTALDGMYTVSATLSITRLTMRNATYGGELQHQQLETRLQLVAATYYRSVDMSVGIDTRRSLIEFWCHQKETVLKTML